MNTATFSYIYYFILHSSSNKSWLTYKNIQKFLLMIKIIDLGLN